MVSDIAQEHLDKASKTLATMLDYLGLEASIKAQQDGDKITLVAASDDAGRIIGRKGQSLESLQLLLNRMMLNVDEAFPRIYIDVDGYSRKSNNRRGGGRDGGGRDGDGRDGGGRRGRGRGDDIREQLKQQALDAAKEVKRWGESVTLPAMSARDRRIIHITLKEDDEVVTESVGDGNRKQIVINLKK